MVLGQKRSPSKVGLERYLPFSYMRVNFHLDIELRTQTRRKLPVATQYYIEFSVGDISQPTITAKEAKNRTSWDNILYLLVIVLYSMREKLNIVSEGDDRSVLRVMVYRKHRVRRDRLVGSLTDTIGVALGKLKGGGTKVSCTVCFIDASSSIKVLEDQLRNDTSDQSDFSGIMIKFALAAEPRGHVNVEERQAIQAVTAASEAVNLLDSTPAAIGLLSSAVGTGTRVATAIQALETTRVWHVLMQRIKLLDGIVTDITEVFGAQRLDFVAD